MSLLDSIQVYENFLEPDNLERIKFDINNAAWSTTGCTDDTEERAIRFLRQDTYKDNFYSVFLLNKIKKRTNKNLDWALQPFPYFNGQAFGQDASIHYDGLGKDEFTFLSLCCLENKLCGCQRRRKNVMCMYVLVDIKYVFAKEKRKCTDQRHF